MESAAGKALLLKSTSLQAKADTDARQKLGQCVAHVAFHSPVYNEPISYVKLISILLWRSSAADKPGMSAAKLVPAVCMEHSTARAPCQICFSHLRLGENSLSLPHFPPFSSGHFTLAGMKALLPQLL